MKIYFWWSSLQYWVILLDIERRRKWFVSQRARGLRTQSMWVIFVRTLRVLLGFTGPNWTLHTQPTAQDTLLGSWDFWLLRSWGSAQLCLASHGPWWVRPTCSPNSQPGFRWRCPIPRTGAVRWLVLLTGLCCSLACCPGRASHYWPTGNSQPLGHLTLSFSFPFHYKLFSEQLTSP